MKLGAVIILFCATIFHTTNGGGIGTVLDFSEFLLDLNNYIRKTRQISEHSDVYSDVDASESMVNAFNEFNSQLEVNQDEIYAVGFQTTSQLLRHLTESIHLEIGLNNLLSHLENVDITYTKMVDYMENVTELEKSTLINFAEEMVGNKPISMQNTINHIYSFLVGKEQEITNREILSLFTNKINHKKSCHFNQSAQQVLYNFFSLIILSEFKGLAIMQTSYLWLNLYNRQGKFAGESEIYKNNFKSRITEITKVFSSVLEDLPREYFRCDPPTHKKGRTYQEVTRLVQGFLQNEISMNKDKSCWKSCEDYTLVQKSHECKDLNYCEKRKCNGKIMNCQFVKSDFTLCPASKRSNRRYDYIKYENGPVYGQQNKCKAREINVDSWWRVVVHCTYCFCLCDESDPNSDRYVSLMPVLSDASENKVVTGLRFRKKNRIFHLQIQQGKLLAGGKIDSSSVKWLPVHDYQITDGNVQNGQEYHTLTYEERAMDLDAIQTNEDYVVTGVRFKKEKSVLKFEIHCTRFDFITGTLNLTDQYWRGNSNGVEFRTFLDLSSLDVPTKGPESQPNFQSNQYFRFTHSDIKKDVAQTTVPFIDTQPVASSQAVPLSGAGIYYKGSKGYGGFIAPKIITYDYSQYLNQIVEKMRDANEKEIDLN